MSRYYGWLVLSLWTLSGSGLLACEGSEDTEPFVPSRPGASQPGGGGEGLSESEACDMLLEARQKVREDLDCDAEVLGCPELIRPFGSDPCERYLYDADSLDACVEAIEEYSSCEDFDRSPCIVIAQVQADAKCDSGSAGGGGESGSSGGTGGTVGMGGSTSTGGGGTTSTTGGTAGQPGVAGEAGSAGAAGAND